MRRPLKPYEGAALQNGLDIVKALNLDEKYGYKIPALSLAAE
ncbi:MAG: hypothetical protein ACPGVS_09770 [Primorskyibacter sp.]